ncbi:MAG: substrate-binding domain-containing protein [Clostridia bacterium]|nr:substrate-binding domain-containing protein [Clostridia bacterium]
MHKRRGIALLLAMCLALALCPIVPLAWAEGDPFADVWGRIDGSTATIPLVQAMRAHFLGADVGKVEHSTTPRAYERLCNADVDLILVTPPSPDDLAIAEEAGVELEIIPVTWEALVFLNNVQNPVESLTTGELRAIYAGQITNWREVGGSNAAILPFQREPRSGSQTLFLACLMGEEEPMKPAKEVLAGSMGGLIEEVAAYNSAPNALGYSVFYYVTRMYMSENIRVLAVDGILPSAQTIADGTYPLCTNYYAVLRKDTAPDDPARQLVAWLLSAEGQRVAAEAGYVPLAGGAPGEAEADAQERARTHMSSGTGGTEPRAYAFFYWLFDFDLDHSVAEEDIPEIPADVWAMADAWWAQASMELYGEEDYEDYEDENITASTALLSMWIAGNEDEEGSFPLRTIVIDIEQKRVLKLSDLFYDGVNYIDYINRHIVFSPEFRLHWDEKGVGYDSDDIGVFTGLPNDYPYFLFYSAHGIGFLYDDSTPFWRSDWTEEGPAYAYVPLNHWISPWGGCTVDIRYQDRLLPQGIIFPVPSFSVDDGHVPEAEARINAALADIAERHIAQADSWASNGGSVEVEVETAGHYVLVDFFFWAKGGRENQATGFLSKNIFDLHTGEWIDTEALFERWKDSPRAAFVSQESWPEALPGYRLAEGMYPASAFISEEMEVKLGFYFADAPEGRLWMKLPMSLIEEEAAGR